MRLKFWVGILISAGLLALMFWRIGFDFHKLWGAMRGIEPWHIAAAVVLNLMFLVVRAVRWRYLMDPVKKRVKISNLYSATMVGFMANNLLPARLGEIVRAYVIGRREDIPKSSAFATIVVERVFDSLSIFGLLTIVLMFMPASISGGSLAGKRFVLLGLSVALIAFTALLIYKQDLPDKIIEKIFRPFPKLSEKMLSFTHRFISGLNVIKNPRLLGLIIFYSVVHWGLLWIPIYIVFKGYGLPIGAYESLFVLVVTCIAVAVPSTPGYIGIFQAAVTEALIPFGVQPETALAISIVLWAIGYIPVTIIGLYCLSRENLTFSSIKAVEEGAMK